MTESTPLNFNQRTAQLADSLIKENAFAANFLNDFRQQQSSLLAEIAEPNRKVEDWKYTSFQPVLKNDFNTLATASNNVSVNAIAELNAAQINIVNGHVQTDSSALSMGEVVLFSQANDAQQTIILEQLDKTISGAQKQNLSTALNGSLLNDGVLIHVKANQALSQPIEVNYISEAQSEAAIAATRLLIIIEDNAKGTVVERTIEPADNAKKEITQLASQVTEIQLGENAKIHHYRLQMNEHTSVNIGGVFVNQGKGSQLNTFNLALGSDLIRNDILVTHQDSLSHSEIAGVYVPNDNEVVDFHTCVEHAVPHCTTNEVFRGIMADKSKAVFNGRIHIHKDAQKTHAEMSNKNLLLSNEAEINTKPELEIYADDVACAHGATVAQLNEEAVYYLQSRGITKTDAEIMMSFGFINELLENLEDEAITRLLRPVLAKRFGREDFITQLGL